MKQQSILIDVLRTTALAATLAVAAPSVFAHANANHKKEKNASISADEHAFGREGDPRNVKRTISVDMHDTMRFTPAEITVRQGETVRFVVHNKGKALHEMVLGTMDDLKEHGELMKKFPEMEHDAPYMAHVPPGGKQEMVWQFTQPGEFNFGCLAPGHFEAGMIGKINVRKGKS